MIDVFSLKCSLELSWFWKVVMKKYNRPFFRRIELNWPLISSKFRFRLARTTLPKPSLSWHPLRGFSLNTTHGVRVSKTFKGITLGFQNLKFVFRGRWSSDFLDLISTRRNLASAFHKRIFLEHIIFQIQIALRQIY